VLRAQGSPSPNRINVEETMSDIVQRAKAALEGATDGPWEIVGGGEYVTGVGILAAPDDGGVTSGDAEFIAQARTLVPELVAEVERLRLLVEDVMGVAVERGKRLDALAVSDE
jgi:hypothetical protein